MSDTNTSADRRLDEAVAALERDVQPARDLWPEIRGQLDRRRPSPWPLAMAAGITVAVAAVLLLSRPSPPPPSSAFQLLQADAAGLDELETARSRMLEELAATADRLPEGSGAGMRASLDGLQAGRVSVDEALQQFPNDSFLQAKLVSATNDELAMIQHISELAQRATTRTQL